MGREMKVMEKGEGRKRGRGDQKEQREGGGRIKEERWEAACSEE